MGRRWRGGSGKHQRNGVHSEAVTLALTFRTHHRRSEIRNGTPHGPRELRQEICSCIDHVQDRQTRLVSGRVGGPHPCNKEDTSWRGGGWHRKSQTCKERQPEILPIHRLAHHSSLFRICRLDHCQKGILSILSDQLLCPFFRTWVFAKSDQIFYPVLPTDKKSFKTSS